MHFLIGRVVRDSTTHKLINNPSCYRLNQYLIKTYFQFLTNRSRPSTNQFKTASGVFQGTGWLRNIPDCVRIHLRTDFNKLNLGSGLQPIHYWSPTDSSPVTNVLNTCYTLFRNIPSCISELISRSCNLVRTYNHSVADQLIARKSPQTIVTNRFKTCYNLFSNVPHCSRVEIFSELMPITCYLLTFELPIGYCRI